MSDSRGFTDAPLGQTAATAGVEARFEGRRILVTGASGFLGTWLCRRLIAGGADLHAVSRTSRESATGGPRWWQASLEDADRVRRLLAEVKPDVLFHLAGAVNGAPDIALVLPTFHSLLSSTVTLLTMATELGCGRIVLVGSLEEPSEPADVCPASPYGAAKWAAGAYGRMFQRLFGAPVVIARTFMSYGPGQPEWKLIPYTILSLLSGKAPELSSGQRQLDWVYVDDVIDGLLRAGCAANVEGASIDLGSGTIVSIREIVERITGSMAAAVTPVFGVRQDRPFRNPRVADTSTAWARLGWRPEVPIERGLALTVEWYRNRHRERLSAS